MTAIIPESTNSYAERRAMEIADKVVPAYRAKGSRHSCTGQVARCWQAAYDGALSMAFQATAPATPSNAGSPNVGEGVIPAGMKAWHGGDSAPADWDGGQVLCGDGAMYGSPIEWNRPSGGPDVIAYTPHLEIPVGMVRWSGGKCAPIDWDGGKVFYRDGGTGLYPHDRNECWSHKNPSPDDIIAYTSRATSPTVPAIPVDREVARHLRDALNDSEELPDGSVKITADHARQLNADVDTWEAQESLTGEEAWDILVNVDDRTSPEEYPDMCLITRDELLDLMARASPAYTPRAVEGAWEFDADSRDITLNGAPVFKVYEADDFPCIEDEDRAKEDEWFDAQAQNVALMLNSLLHDSGDDTPIPMPVEAGAIGQSDGDPDGWLAVKVNGEGGIVMPYGPLHPHSDCPNDPRYQWAPFYLGEPR